MKIKIPKIELDAFEVFGDEILEAELDQQENAVKSVWTGIYADIASGKSNLAYWDISHIARSKSKNFMRYALHRSTKKDGFLQLSVMEIRNGKIIPTADSQHDSAEDFISRSAWGYGAETVIIE